MLFLDSLLLIAAAASFVAGVLGYIIARLWIKPIVGYTVAKRKLDRELNRYLKQMSETSPTTNGKIDASAGERVLRSARKLAMDLLSHYNGNIPYWYRLLLDSRQESPERASGLLTNLNKIHDPQQRRSRIVAAKKELQLHEKKTTPK